MASLSIPEMILLGVWPLLEEVGPLGGPLGPVCEAREWSPLFDCKTNLLDFIHPNKIKIKTSIGKGKGVQ